MGKVTKKSSTRITAMVRNNEWYQLHAGTQGDLYRVKKGTKTAKK